MLTNDGLRPRRRYPRTLVVAAFAVTLATVAAAPAAVAKPIANSRDHIRFSFSQNLCGVDVDSKFMYWAQELRRVNKEGLPLYRGMFFTTEIHTNPDNGRSVVIRGSVTLLDLRATFNDDGTYTVLTQQTGRAQDIRLDDGTHVGRYAKRLGLETIYDHNDTPAYQNDDTFIDGRLVSASGRFSILPPEYLTHYCEEIAARLT